MPKYDVQNIKNMISKTGCITFLSVISIGKDILRITCKTYKINKSLEFPNLDTHCSIPEAAESLAQFTEGPWIFTDSEDIIMKDEKRRKASTLEKAGISQKEHENGIEKKQAAKILSEYFIKNNCLIIADKAGTKVRMLNRVIAEYEMKNIACCTLDIGKMIKKCEIEAEIKTGPEEIESIAEAVKKCLKIYAKLEKISRNKCGCTVSYAYYWENEKVCDMMWIICVTSIGKIYYDTIYDRWGITQKEHKKTGLVIEHFDINDIKCQLMQKYHVRTMEELRLKLIAIRKEREERIAV